MANEAHNNLRDLQRATRTLVESEDEAARRTGNKLSKWFQAGCREPLDKALQLRARGGVSAQRAEDLARRDRMLRIAAAELYPTLAPSAASRMLSQSFRDYESRRWPRDRKLSEYPRDLPAGAWWALLKFDLPMPDCRRLTQILESKMESAEIQSCV